MDRLWQLLEDTPRGPGAFTPQTIILSLLLAFALGQILAWVYYVTHKGLSYSRSYVQSLIVIAVVISAVMAVVGNNIVAGAGVLGVVAVARMRSMVKDVRDIAFLLCTLAVGIATGSQRYVTAILGTGILSLIVLYLGWTDFGGHEPQNGFLRFSLRGPFGPDHPVPGILQRYCGSFTLIAAQGGISGEPMEYAYQVLIRNTGANGELLSELEKVEGIGNVRLIMEDKLLVI
jgi:hypothetical protein